MYPLKIVVALLAVAVPVLLFELGLRMVREKMDYLAPELIPDPVLGYRIDPHTGGHDGWGFRNLEVPRISDVVALGDSNTWGVAARWEESWPNWYARKSGKSVYNLGVSGYGPPEYLHLLETRALALDPELVVIGLYYGNDFHDTYRSVARRERWGYLRKASMVTPEEGVQLSESMPGAPFINDKDADSNPIKQLRNGLRRNSMLFRIIEEGPIGQRVNAWGDQSLDFGGTQCSLQLDSPFPTVVQIDQTLWGLDLEDVEIEEGIQLALSFVKRLSRVARENGAEVLVVLIPTKVSVLMRKSDEVPPGCRSALEKVLEYEEEIGVRVRRFLQEQGIAFVDTLEPLRDRALEEAVYLRSADTHPNGEGYEVIAEEIVKATARKSDSLRDSQRDRPRPRSGPVPSQKSVTVEGEG
ncbi:MAG: SGNH/GDSL hydrolase family protein [Myxococcota bacterium]|nr:SGNH/GDSL hydrolase family protein [Myxococcota bacterium]